LQLARTPEDIRQQLFASLTSACLALDELDHVAIRDLRDDGDYIAKMNRLMVPMFTSPTPAAIQASCKCATLMIDILKFDLPQLREASQGPSETVPPVAGLGPRTSSPITPCILAEPSTSALPGPSSLPTSNPIRRMRLDEPIPELRPSQQLVIVAELLIDLESRLFADKSRGYVVDMGWWRFWIKACTVSKDPPVQAAGIRFTMNPIDNTSLVDPSTGLLRKGLTAEDKDDLFVVVDKAIWEDCFVKWCA